MNDRVPASPSSYFDTRCSRQSQPITLAKSSRWFSRAARQCRAQAVQTIADHTRGFIKRVATALLGVVLGVLLGNLPQKLAAKFKEFVKGIRDLVRKLIKALLEKLKRIFGRKGAEGQTDPEGEAPACVHITVRNSGTPQRGGDRRAGCFVAGTLVHTPKGCRPIETLAIGQCVTTLLPGERQLIGPPQQFALPESSELRLVRLRMTKPSGGACRLALLRSREWLHDIRACVGGTVYLNMPEMGVKGEADVLAIEPCPEIEPGPGRIVTGTFAHTAGEVYDLKVAGEPKPLGVTGAHPVWSLDRDTWVPAAELRIGENVKTLARTTQVESIGKRLEPQPVFNIEVEGDHVYRVGHSGVLVHNNSVDDSCPSEECTDFSDSYMRQSVVEIHRGFTHFLARTLRTTAVATAKDNAGNWVCLFSVSGNNQTEEVERRAKRHGFTVLAAGNDHAELNILNYATDKKLRIIKLAPCRPACGPESRDCRSRVLSKAEKLLDPVGGVDRCKNPDA